MRHDIIVNGGLISQFNIKLNEIVKIGHNLNLLDEILHLIFQLMS